MFKTASDIHTAATAVQEQLAKVSHRCQETESEINPSKEQALWCTLNKAVGQAMPAVSLNGTREQSHIPRDPFRQNADIQDAGRINKAQVQTRTVRIESHGFKRHGTASSVPVVSECNTRRH